MINKKVNFFKFFPLLIFFLLILVAFIALQKYDGESLPSVLIGKSPPPLVLENLGNYDLVSKKDLDSIKENKIRLVNFWASWCPPCRVEHPQLERLSELENVELYGVNYKDKKNSALNFLKEYGNPFLKIGTDQSGRNAIEWGVYGVPETFAIDQEGRVLFRHAGPITKEIMKTKFYKFINQ
tara:strand:+ start:1373 stop:1918 length:546 start_codon:yes stop_codon:yes gene_type:complete